MVTATKKRAVSAGMEDRILRIKAPNFQFAEITLVGETPLLVNQFSAKAREEMESKQQKLAKGPRVAKDPLQCFKDSLYVIDEKKGRYGIPAGGIKNCIVSGCRFVEGVPMTKAIGAFHVMATDFKTNLVEIIGSEPIMVSHVVRVGKFGNKTADIRYRGQFNDWKIIFKIKYNPDILSAEQIANIAEYAGFSVGLCEWRTEKRGNLGMFHVARL